MLEGEKKVTFPRRVSTYLYLTHKQLLKIVSQKELENNQTIIHTIITVYKLNVNIIIYNQISARKETNCNTIKDI